MALLPVSDIFLSENSLRSLTELVQQHQQFDNSIFAAELKLAGPLLSRKLQAADKNGLQKAALCMVSYKDAFPLLNLYYAAGVSTATCENTFSCLSRILKPQNFNESSTEVPSGSSLDYICTGIVVPGSTGI